MTDISMLIKEAKPLYYKRKKQRQLIKNISVGVSMSLLLGVLAMNQIAPKTLYPELDEHYVCLYDDSSYDSYFQLLAEEDIFPTDEYGLILVSA